MFWLSCRPVNVLVSTRQSARLLSKGAERLPWTVWLLPPPPNPPWEAEGEGATTASTKSTIYSAHIISVRKITASVHVHLIRSGSHKQHTSVKVQAKLPAHSCNLWNIYITGLLATVSHSQSRKKKREKRRRSGITPQVTLKSWFLKKPRMWSERGPGRLTTQGEPRAKAGLSSESRHSQSKLLRNCLNFCKPPPSLGVTGLNQRVHAWMNERVCVSALISMRLCTRNQKKKKKKKKPKSVAPTWSQVQGQIVQLVRQTAELAKGPRWQRHGQAHCQIYKKKIWKRRFAIFP